MSFLSALLRLFGGGRRPSQPPPPLVRPLVIRTGVARAMVRVSDEMLPRIADVKGDAAFDTVSGTAFNLHASADGFEDYHLVVEWPADSGVRHFHLTDMIPITEPSFERALPLWKRTTRGGIVKRQGKAVADQQGLFHPLGCTMFWALWGWKFDRERYQQNIDFLSRYKYDYVRVACHTGWPNERIDPNWPDYAMVLGDTIDYHYARGLRTALFVIGDPLDSSGPFAFNLNDFVTRIASVVNAGRQHKVIYIEMCNEHWGKLSVPTMRSMMVLFQVSLSMPRPMLALSSPGEFELLKQAADETFAELFTIHTDRDAGARGSKWRQVRQGWDFRSLPQVVDSNEPPGPQSSVDTNESPLQLALMRATGVISGGAMFVNHIAAMVTGDHTGHMGRPADIWDVPNIVTILKVVRGIDSVLPPGVENWTHCSVHGSNGGSVVSRVGPSIPLLPDAIWSDSDDRDHGVDRSYAAVNNDTGEFVQVVLGVFRSVTLTPAQSLHVDAYDPVTMQVVASADLPVGTSWSLVGSEDTQAGYILKGQYR